MEDRPIIFSTPMVQAIQDGRKTQTRRVIKPQPIRSPYWTHYENSGAFYPATLDAEPSVLKCPYGVRGSKLWVRETFTIEASNIWYKADGTDHDGNVEYPDGFTHVPRWKPSIHMPKKHARIWLEITGVRVERLQDISDEDVLHEGFKMTSATIFSLGYTDAFAGLWDSINKKKHPWESNVWVWVVKFRRLSP